MATYLTDKCNEIRRWLAIGSDVYPDSVVTTWIRMAEEQLSTELRVKHMIQIDVANVIIDRVPLPLDWQEIRLARFLPNGGALRYQTPDAFYNPEFPEDAAVPYPGKAKHYTILGNYLIVGDANADGVQVELTYYQDIPPLTEGADNWINKYHPSVYLLKILHIASMYSIEDERGPTWEKQVMSLVGEMNVRHTIDRASGSTLQLVRRKTFG